MDAHSTVTAEEGDRYPLRPPSYAVMDRAGARKRASNTSCRRGSSPLTAPSFVSVDVEKSGVGIH